MNEVVFTKSLFEFIGTAILVLFGDGVVASNLLKKSKGENGGWVVVTLAWGLAVMLGVFISGPYSGAHLNPAVTLGLAAAGTFSWSLVVPYIVAQMLGGFTGPYWCIFITRTTTMLPMTRQPNWRHSVRLPQSATTDATCSAKSWVPLFWCLSFSPSLLTEIPPRWVWVLWEHSLWPC